jgi:hypothetical protein
VKTIEWEIHFSVLFDIYRKIGESRGHGDKEITERGRRRDKEIEETERQGDRRDGETRRQ